MEIARLLSRNAQILILDEPTAALSDVEIEKVTSVVTKLAKEGRSIIYVTHRLGEVFEIADRVTIFRNGVSFEPIAVKGLSVDTLIERLLGRRLEQMFPARASKFGEVVLSTHNLVAPGLSRPVSLESASRGNPRACRTTRQRRQRHCSRSGRRRSAYGADRFAFAAND